MNKSTNDRERLMELKPGFRWARIAADKGKENDWLLIYISGIFPFMSAKVVFNPHVITGEHGTALFKLDDPSNNPGEWEFGPELNLPSKDWVRIEMAKPDDQ